VDVWFTMFCGNRDWTIRAPWVDVFANDRRSTRRWFVGVSALGSRAARRSLRVVGVRVGREDSVEGALVVRELVRRSWSC
jgi:hypothetical protein